MEKIKGNAKECLSHFFKNVMNTNDAKQISFLGRFLGISETKPMLSWAQQESSPIGLRLLKTIFILKSLKYEIKEIDFLPETVFETIELIALDQIKPNEACAKIGYYGTDHLYRVLSGKTNPSRKAVAKMAELVSAYPNGSPLLEEFFVCFGVSSSIKVKKIVKKTQSEIKEIILEPERQLKTVASWVRVIGNTSEMLEPILERYIEEPDNNVRERLRALVEDERFQLNLFKVSNSVYRFSQLLNALCSEKAREKFNSSLKPNNL